MHACVSVHVCDRECMRVCVRECMRVREGESACVCVFEV